MHMPTRPDSVVELQDFNPSHAHVQTSISVLQYLQASSHYGNADSLWCALEIAAMTSTLNGRKEVPAWRGEYT